MLNILQSIDIDNETIILNAQNKLSVKAIPSTAQPTENEFEVDEEHTIPEGDREFYFEQKNVTLKHKPSNSYIHNVVQYNKVKRADPVQDAVRAEFMFNPYGKSLVMSTPENAKEYIKFDLVSNYDTHNYSVDIEKLLHMEGSTKSTDLLNWFNQPSSIPSEPRELNYVEGKPYVNNEPVSFSTPALPYYDQEITFKALKDGVDDVYIQYYGLKEDVLQNHIYRDSFKVTYTNRSGQTVEETVTGSFSNVVTDEGDIAVDAFNFVNLDVEREELQHAIQRIELVNPERYNKSFYYGELRVNPEVDISELTR